MKSTLHTGCLWSPERRPHADIRLIIAHHAGGSSTAYVRMAKALSPRIEVFLVELPGRATRRGYEPYLEFKQAVDSLVQSFAELAPKPTAFFGHSMGGLLIFEAALALTARGLPPVRLFLSAVRPPQYYGQSAEDRYDAATFTDEWLIDRLKKHEGTPPEVFENKELLEIILPVYRADYLLIESYQATRNLKLRMPLTVMGGEQDQGISRDHLEEWRKESLALSSIHVFDGGHFYLFQNLDKVIPIIHRDLGVN